MGNELKNILLEIEEIIAKIGNYNIGKARLSEQGNRELKQLFDKKIKEAKLLTQNYDTTFSTSRNSEYIN